MYSLDVYLYLQKYYQTQDKHTHYPKSFLMLIYKPSFLMHLPSQALTLIISAQQIDLHFIVLYTYNT